MSGCNPPLNRSDWAADIIKNESVHNQLTAIRFFEQQINNQCRIYADNRMCRKEVEKI